MRYYVVPQFIHQKTINFTEEQTHHMRKVLRLKPGDKVECFDEKGNIYFVEVKKLSRDGSYGTVYNIENKDLSNKKYVTLIQALPSALPKLDLVVEKCTELGIDNFIFFKSKRSETLVLPSEDKIKRWKKIAIKASEQSRRYTVPQIFVEENISSIDFSVYDSKLFLYEKSENLEFPAIKDNKNIIFAIGPEGGWEEMEVEKFKEFGFTDIKPFENILRTETASVAVSSVILCR